MPLNKRGFLKFSTALGITAALPRTATSTIDPDHLQDITGHVVPISVAERQARVAKAQRLMQEAGIDALLLEAGSALVYFTHLGLWRTHE
jgi:Xaa-Pro dipeptidase